MSPQDRPARADQATRLMNRLSAGDAGVSEELLELVYAELHDLAAAHMARERPDHTLQPTALVGEAYLRLVGARDVSWESRRQFYAMASKVMRSLLVDHARERRAQKRGGDRARIPLGTDVTAPGTDPRDATIDLLDLNDALERLALVDPTLAQAVELRWFGGLGVNETAAALGLPVRTAERRLRAASAWLRDRLGG